MASRDNVYEYEVDGTRIVCEASLGASSIYAEQFAGELKEPYNGNLKHDILVAYERAQETVTIRVEVDDDGEPLRDEAGDYVRKPNGTPIEIENERYAGFDVEECIRIMWATSRAANGGTRRGFEQFRSWMLHTSADSTELYHAVMGGPANHYFRDGTGLFRVVEPDDAEGDEGDA